MVAFLLFSFFIVFRNGFAKTTKTLRYISITDANEIIKNEKQNKTKENVIKNGKIYFMIENTIFGG
jgi:hypothetical protein